MSMKWLFLLLPNLLFLACCSLQNSSAQSVDHKAIEYKFPVLSGPYLGQALVGDTPELFAYDIISHSAGLGHARDIAITPDGQEIYFSSNNENHTQSRIYVTKIVNGVWTEPAPVPFASDASLKYGEPFLSSDGSKMYFVSVRPIGSRSDYNIWYVERVGDDWGEPKEIGLPINSEFNEFFPSVTASGTIYFTRTIPSDGTYIFRSKLLNGEYSEPEKLGPEINATNDQYNAFIAPDESYIIVPNGQRGDSFGGSDYYICFRNDNDGWEGSFNLGDQVNSRFSREWSASVSPDGEYLFFMSDRGPTDPGRSKIFWINAAFLSKLNPND